MSDIPIIMKQTLIKLFIIAAVMGHGAVAFGSESSNLMEKASSAFVPLFQSPPDLSGSSVMPFRGRVISSDCEGKTGDCMVSFEVTEIFFDQISIMQDLFHINAPAVKKIDVVALGSSLVPKDISVGSEWLVVAYNYGGSDGSGSGNNADCGEWMGEIRNEIVFYNGGKSQIPYALAKEQILRPVVSAGQAGKDRLRTIYWNQAMKLLKP